jgi:hypothetical protein
MYVFLVESSSRRGRRPREPVEELVDRRLRPRVPALVKLAQQPPARLLSLRCGSRARRDDPDKVVTLACHRVGAGVDPHPVGAARQPVDGAALASVVEPESLDAARGSGQDRSHAARPSPKDGGTSWLVRRWRH